MKICFKNADALLECIALLADDLGIESVSEAADLTVSVNEVSGNALTVTLSGKDAAITYGGGKSRFNRGLAMLVKWVNDKETEKTVTENPLFTLNGAMVDMSRNAVMNLKTVKFMMRKMALMGMNAYMLYTEDTYEVEGHPYFGYMRGRYTREELKELDAYALTLGIELIPCVQMLGHLATYLRWAAAAPVKDSANALLVGADETYALIDDMLKNISECFTTRRIHIGMDETHDLGTGGYLDRFGYRKRQEIYFAHMAKVKELVLNHGLKPMMWSDMFFRLVGGDLPAYRDYDPRVEFSDEIRDLVPSGIQQVFWDYYNPDEEFYAVNIDKHKKYLDEQPLFAGGIWHWSGHCPHYSRSLRHTIPALEACRKKGIKEVIATVWHNGSEASLILSLAGMAWYADYDYKGGWDMESAKECLRFACGLEHDDFMKCELPEYPHGGEVGVSRELVYNDPLIGLMDKHIEGLDTCSYYKNVTEELTAAAEDKGEFAPAFDVILKLSSLLIEKADFGVRLKAAYDSGDKVTLTAMAEECDRIIGKLAALRHSHRTSWMRYNKPFGWEVHDIRYGGLISRFETAKFRLESYLAGEIDSIEELEAERLRFDGKPDIHERFDDRFLWHSYRNIATAGIL